MTTASEGRAGALEEHEALRELSRHVLELANRAERGEAAAREALVEQLYGLTSAIRAKLGSEVETLRPLLEQADAWGPSRAQELDESHRRQEAAAAACEADVTAAHSGADVAAVARELVRELVRSLRWEAREVLGDELLRDDVIVVDQEGG
jgi:hypothetical protein